MRGITEKRLKDLFSDPGHSGLLSSSELYRELQELNLWQPIETAPKDRRILLYYPSKVTKIVTGQYSTKFKCFFFNDGNFSFVHSPTHWMELPEPPK